MLQVVVEDSEAAPEVIEEEVVFVADEAVDEAEVIGVLGVVEEVVEEEEAVAEVRFSFSEAGIY